jgi:hypothetical protein
LFSGSEDSCSYSVGLSAAWSDKPGSSF